MCIDIDSPNVCCVQVCVSASTHQTYCQFMLSSCSTNHADIRTNRGETAADNAREWGYPALADYVEGFQPGPRGELVISCCTQ